MNKKVAIIDLGTNTFHLLIASWDGRYRIIHRERLPTKIGMGGINDGVITDQGIDRALVALRKFKDTLQNQSVKDIFAFGTSALRNARNGQQVATRIREETGIQVTIISGDQEAEYIYRGVRAALPLNEQPSLIVDIGGGSVEFIIGNKDRIFWKQSLEIGAQRLLEKFHRHDPMITEELVELFDFLQEMMEEPLHQINHFKPTELVGSSGTFDTLSDIYCLRKGMLLSTDASETPLSFSGFHEIYQELLSKNRAQRLQIPGMIEMRVDMIVVACCLIKYLLDHYRFESIRVSTWSLKEGVLAMLSDDDRQKQTA